MSVVSSALTGAFDKVIALSTTTPSHLRVALSGISSSISLACWIVLLLPQLIEQWRLKSSEGISPLFIGIWLFGDLCNLIGSIWAGLLPGVILLAVWFCFADILMFFSYFYYKNPSHGHTIRRRSTNASIEEGESSTRPLLENSESLGQYSAAGSSGAAPKPRRKSSKRHRRDSLASIVNAPPSKGSIFQQFVLPILFVVAAGVVGYLFSDKETQNQNPGNGDEDSTTKELGPMILGYLSAVLYLGARIPQIVQNYKKKSVYGLSLLFFLFSIMGNLSYSGGILFYRTDWEYVKLYLPWLLGSLGTVFEDVIIIIQFSIYGPYVHIENESAIIED